jgi:hypothetical protein
MGRTERALDHEVLRSVARYAGLPIGPADEGARLAGMETMLQISAGWAGLGLGYRFDPDGGFGRVPALPQHIPAWDVPTGLNKGRVLVERDGAVQLVDAERES